MIKYLYIILLLTLVSNLYSQSALITEVEAETGVLVGTTVSSSGSGYSGTGFVTGMDATGDKLSVTVTVPTKQMYKILIRYRCSGSKTQDFKVNNGYSSPVYFPSTSSFIFVEAGSYLLEAGPNTLSIIKSWGYTDFDKFEVYEAEENVFDIAPALVDPDANSQAMNLYEFLKMQFGKRIISGQTSGYYDNVKNLTSKSPMLMAGDFAAFTDGYPYKWVNGAHTFGKVPDNTVTNLINWYNSTGKKGLVAMHWHWASPTGGVAGTNTFYTDLTTFDITKAVTPGTAEYNYIIRDIDAVAAELKKFQTAGVPILWRPLHEAGGGWFWWGAKGPVACKKLWNIMYDRMMNYHQLHNLIWVWSTPETDWYPGNDKVDIIGHDSYPGDYNYGNQKNTFDRLFKLTSGKKLIAMTENGPIPDVDESLDFGAPWLYFMSWVDLVRAQNSNEHIIEVFNHPRVLTLESENMYWRSLLYPIDWKPQMKDAQGRFLHDFSYAGYHQGELQIPERNSNIIDVTLPPYSADNTGTDDVTAIIQTAINDASENGGGVVYLPAGTYRIKTPLGSSYALGIHSDSIILRGAGPENTFLFHDEWNMRFKNIIQVSSQNASWFSPVGDSSAILYDLSDPTKIIPLQSVADFNKGDLVILMATVSDEFIAEHKMAGIWDAEALKGVAFLRRIDSIDVSNKLIYIDSPTRYPLKTRDNARVYHVKKHIQESGIENLSIGNIQNPNVGLEEEDYTIPGTAAYEVHFSHVISVENAENCWIKNVKSYKPVQNLMDVELLSNGIVLNQCKNVSIDSCFFQKPQYEGGGGNGYMFTLESNDCLIKNSTANHGRHNFDFKYPYSNGNVIYNCRAENSKYASDFHMYLSMANLFDKCTLNFDYLESAFRPYGGSAIHGYTSTQSVFYNTVGEAYHPNKDYLIDSRQFGNGYVIGTSGPANEVVSEPVAGTDLTYDFDTAPIDFVEGVGKGAELQPVSLYLDQFERRMKDTVQIKKYRVELQIIDASSSQILKDVTIFLNNKTYLSDTSGVSVFTGLNANFSLGFEKNLYQNYSTKQFSINKDTSIVISLMRNSYTLLLKLLDINTNEKLWGATASIDGTKKSADTNGEISFDLKWGEYQTLFEKISYQAESQIIGIYSDTTIIQYLLQTMADAKFRLKNAGTPVNNAVVKIAQDSLITNSLGIALFKDFLMNLTYSYTIYADGYFSQTGEFLLLKDTTIDVEMVKSDVGTGMQRNMGVIKLWPNPVSDILYISLEGYAKPVSAQITNITGKNVLQIQDVNSINELSVRALPAGVYILKISSDDKQSDAFFIKE